MPIYTTPTELASLRANITEAREVGLERITLSLTLEEAESLLKVQEAIEILCQSTQHQLS